jgi:hypothetical protein
VSKVDDLHRWQDFGEHVPGSSLVVERCSFCSFEIVSSFEEARAAFEQHKCGRPKPEPTKRRASGFKFR